jgi:hypothetical protein
MAIPSRQIGWGTESNLLWQILKQLNKLTSVLFGLKEAATPNYKVYTALLTQSGGSNTTGISSGPLTKGITYKIQVDGGDFANVGAPNNNADTYFVATESITPTSYGGYALLYNTGAPVVTVLENTIGNVWFTYVDTGTYYMQSSGLFLNDKTWYSILANVNGGSNHMLNLTYIDNSTILVEALNGDDLLNNTPIEIRVYN